MLTESSGCPLHVSLVNKNGKIYVLLVNEHLKINNTY